MAKKNITEKISDEIIVYKVIDSDTRFGTNYSVFCWENSKSSFLELIEKNPKIKKYFPVYSKDSLIKYVEGSVGLMTFDKINNALKFIKSEDSLEDLKKYDKIKIIKVLINKKNILRKPKFIKAHCGGDPLFLISTGCAMKYVPEGTIFCKSLTVLD